MSDLFVIMTNNSCNLQTWSKKINSIDKWIIILNFKKFRHLKTGHELLKDVEHFHKLEIQMFDN